MLSMDSDMRGAPADSDNDEDNQNLSVKKRSTSGQACSAAIINVYDFIDDFISLWYESLHG